MDKVRLTFFYALLIVITLAVLTWHHYGMEKQFVMFPNESISPTVYSDPQYGGRSKTMLESSPKGTFIKCRTISSSRIHPFCGISLAISDLGGDQDLSSYDELIVTLSADSTEPDTVMIYLVNTEFDSNAEPFERVNLRTINAAKMMRNITLPLDSFYVPSWWLLFNPEDPYGGKPNVSNVTALRITTGDSRLEREVQLHIERISAHGKYIKQSKLYLAIIIVWISVSLFFVIANMVAMRRHTLASKKRARELENLNNFLAIEKNKFESMAKRDALTGALNRAGLRQVIDEACNAYREQGTSNSLILFDIDHFKVINDTYGHQMGDEALVELVKLISATIRDDDYLARWGGEEFALICLRTNASDAVLFAEKLRHTINTAQLAGLSVSCSFGVAQLCHEDVASWFGAADEALYEAKEKGRNQVRVK